MKVTKLLGLIAFIIGLAMIACDNSGGGVGTFSISFGSSAGRAALSDAEISKLSYTIILSDGPGETQKKNVDGAQTVSFSVTPGEWKISVEAYEGKNLRAEGSTKVNIKPGPNGAVSIKMNLLYRIGDKGPAGGIIFYINPYYETDGWRCLEAAPASAESSSPHPTWGASNIDVGTSDQVGTGKNNTRLILEALALTTESGTAAQFCRDLDTGGYKDWFLPSYNELQLMYDTNGLGGFANGYYWSSSEVDNISVLCLYSSDGSQYIDWKSYSNHVRAIRAF